MAFVNEHIPAEDIQKYGLDEIDRKYRLGLSRGTDWTVDRERGYYLRHMERCREEQLGEHVYDLYWNGHLIRVRVKQEGGGLGHGRAWRRYRLLNLDMPQELEAEHDAIAAVLKEALTAYGDFGILSRAEMTLTFEF